MLNNCEAKGLGCVLTLPIYRGREQHGNGREAGDKGTGSGRVRYGRREVLTPLSPPTINEGLINPITGTKGTIPTLISCLFQGAKMFSSGLTILVNHEALRTGNDCRFEFTCSHFA